MGSTCIKRSKWKTNKETVVKIDPELQMTGITRSAEPLQVSTVKSQLLNLPLVLSQRTLLHKKERMTKLLCLFVFPYYDDFRGASIIPGHNFKIPRRNSMPIFGGNEDNSSSLLFYEMAFSSSPFLSVWV